MFRKDCGQDVIEYVLVMAFVCVASAALFIGSGQSVAGVWSSPDTELGSASMATGAGNSCCM